MFFKWFLILVGCGIGTVLAVFIINWIKNKIIKWKLNRPVKVKKEKKKPKTAEDIMEEKTADFEERLLQQYETSVTELLKRQKVAEKTLSCLQDSINNYTQQAKRCKEQFEKTGNTSFQKNAYVFLSELENSKNLLKLAKETIRECIDKIEIADIDYQALVCRIRNKKIEYMLLSEGNGSTSNNKSLESSLMKEFDYNQILDEYKAKIDVKRIDIEVNKNITEQKALNPSSFDLNLIPETLKVEYEKL